MLLEVRDLHTHYGTSHVLQGVDLDIAAGEVFGLFGRNGVGKTTLVHTIAGFLRPSRGTVTLDGRRIDGLPAEKIAAGGVGLVPQGRRVFRSLSVGEHLSIAARDRRQAGWSVDAVCDRFPLLARRWEQRAGLLSGGEQQMLSIARALVAAPALVLMDEPFEGLDPDRVHAVAEVVRDLRAGGTGVLVVEQHVDTVLVLADSVAVMERGRLTYRADQETLEKDATPLYAELGFA